MSYNIAIIGSGPAGFYSADALIKALPECRIDFIERLPTPFELREIYDAVVLAIGAVSY